MQKTNLDENEEFQSEINIIHFYFAVFITLTSNTIIISVEMRLSKLL
jgi:hypothetical protein